MARYRAANRDHVNALAARSRRRAGKMLKADFDARLAGRDQELCRRYASGEPVSSLARAFKIGEPRVYQICFSHGTHRNDRLRPDARAHRNALIVTAVQAGTLSFAEIAAQVGLSSPDQVRSIALLAGVRRPKRKSHNARDDLTVDELHSRLYYDPDTGLFTRLTSRGGNHVGSIAGALDGSTGYVTIRVNRHSYGAHRLAWLYVYGRWPMGVVDHINGFRSDNRLTNLREATQQQNTFNTPRPRHNTTGFKGVSYIANIKRWRATIRANGHAKHIGTFKTVEEAYAAYCEHAKTEHGQFARVA